MVSPAPGGGEKSGLGLSQDHAPTASERTPQVAPSPRSGALRLPFDRNEMPGGVQRLAVDGRGYPVPWFVDRAAPLVDGNPDFRIMDGKRFKTAIRERRCWVCGEPIRTKTAVFVAGPMCGINRTSAEPPCHSWCAEWSARACPFLTVPKRLRNERDLPNAVSQAGVGIKRNPGVTMLWESATYKTWKPAGGGTLFNLGEPAAYGVEWLREGRPATREEVLESVETGLPILLGDAARESAVACFELGRMTERFMAYLPEADAIQATRAS